MPCAPHNPAGYLPSREPFMRAVELARRHGPIPFGDELCRGLVFDEDERLPTACDFHERAVSLGCLSNSHGLAGLRLGWIATRDAELLPIVDAWLGGIGAGRACAPARGRRARIPRRWRETTGPTPRAKHAALVSWAPPSGGVERRPSLPSGSDHACRMSIRVSRRLADFRPSTPSPDPMDITTHRTANDIAITLRRPDAAGALPVIVLCHGFCGIQELLLPRFAEAFVAAGYAAVTFDYRGFGASGGEQGRLVPAMQIEDIATVLEFVKALPGIDAARIGLWGTSLGGGHVLAAAAADPAVKAVVSQLSFADGEQVVTRSMSEEEKQAFVSTLERMREKKAATGREMFVAITKVLTDEQSKAFVVEARARHPEMDIKIPFLTVHEMLNYKPAEAAARVACPVLVVVAGEDGVNPPEQGTALYEAVGASVKELFVEAGAGHYDMYDGQHFEHSIAKQLAWFGAHV